MPIPLSITVYQPGAGGIPTTTVLATLGGRIDDYEHTITNEIGFDSMRCTFAARDLVECVEWMNNLGASVVVVDPEGRAVWEGLLFDVDVTFGRKTAAVSLDDVANSVRVKYAADSGVQAATSDVTSAASIARYGTKMRAINFSTSTATAAAARAAVVLSQTAWPRSKQAGGAETGAGGGGASITLQFRGWWHTLDWLLLSSSSTTTTQTSAQVATLLAAYNSTNAFFSTLTAKITATGVSDTEYVESETTYAEQIPKLLASGNSSSQRVVFGVYETRALTVEPWAGATPSTITYYESDRDQVIRDAYGNIVEPWSLRPNAMAQLVDLVEPTPASGPIDTLTRRYIKRVTCRISRSGVSGTLEPDDVDTLEELLTRPAGGTATGTSDRQNKVERTIARPARTRFSPTNGRVDLGGGSIDTGGGTIDLDSGGGTITLPGGGGTVTLPPPGGGGATLLDGSGTAGQLAKWSDADTLTNATAGTDYATAGHTHTPGGTGLAPIGAKYIVQQADSDLTNEQALGALSTGILKNTTTTGVLSIAVAGTDYVAPSALDELIDDRVGALLVAGNLITLTYNDAGNALTIAVSSLNETIDDRVAALLVAGTGISLSYNDAGNALTISSTGGTVGGSGTAGRLMQWASGGADAENSTLAKTGAGVLTLATGTTTLTLTLSGGSGQIDFTTPSSNDALIYDGSKFTPTPISSSTISNFNEAVDDRVAALLVAGTGIGLSYNDAGNALTINGTTGTVGGSGTAGRLTQWATGGANIENSTLAKTGAGVLTLSAAGTYTLTVPGTGTVPLGTGVADRIAYWSGTNTVTSNANLEFDGLDLYTNSLRILANLYVSSTQVVGARRTGWSAPSGAVSRATFAAGTVTLSDLAQRVAALINDLLAHGLIGA